VSFRPPTDWRPASWVC